MNKTDIQQGDHGGYLGLLIETSFTIFDLQVALIFLPSFESTDLSVQENQVDF